MWSRDRAALIAAAWRPPQPEGWESLVEQELAEDIGAGDLTEPCLPADTEYEWYIEAQAPGIACGVAIAAHILQADKIAVHDGDAVEDRTLMLSGKAPARWLLKRERTALNFLMHLSGIATLTHQYVKAVEGTEARILDTRKTLPGLRRLQKYAVRCGGGQNHRFRLDDGLMIKDNHIRMAGSIPAAVELAQKSAGHMTKIEVECESIEQAREAVAAGADIVMLDNMAPDLMREAVSELGGKVVLEASGGINLETVRAVAETGIHTISVGALTHSAPSLSIHLEIRDDVRA